MKTKSLFSEIIHYVTERNLLAQCFLLYAYFVLKIFQYNFAFACVRVQFCLQINLNVGNTYDSRHGIFTAPVDGPYEFTFATLVPGGKQTAMELVKNGEPMAKTVSGDNSYYTMATNVVDLDLKAGTCAS
jgi:hypothetical protein